MNDNHHQPPPQQPPPPQQQQQQQQQQLPPLPPTPPHAVCEECNADDQLILHNIILTPKSPPQKLCTSCVLQHYHKSICAQCFELYDANSLTPPPLTAAATTTANHRLLSCMRCDNWSHPGCLRPHVPRTPYICPPCLSSSPNYKYFDCRKPKKSDRTQENGGGKIEKDAARQLLGAARIAAITVGKAAGSARVEAERRAKEAALARKRAREAIDHVVAVAVKVESVKRREVSTVIGPKSVNCVPVRLEKDGGGNVGDGDVENVVARQSEGKNGGAGTVNVPASVVMPAQQHHDNKNNSVGVGVGNGGGGGVGVGNGGGEKDGGNGVQSQAK